MLCCLRPTRFPNSSHFSVLVKSGARRRGFMMTSPNLKEPRRFRPLKEGAGGEGKGEVKGQVLRGVVFDVDGTLCLPQTWMFAQFRSAISIDKSIDILDHINALPPVEQEAAFAKIRAIESSAMESQAPQPGLLPLMQYLESRSLPKGICTRNFDAPVNHLLSKFLPTQTFAPIVTRDFKPPKPSPAGILHIAKSWGFVRRDPATGEEVGDGSNLIMVGDSIDDMTAGYAAGAATVLLVNEINAHLAEHEHTDLCVARLDELIEILESGFVGRIARGDEGGDTRGRAEGVLESGKGEESGK